MQGENESWGSRKKTYRICTLEEGRGRKAGVIVGPGGCVESRLLRGRA